MYVSPLRLAGFTEPHSSPKDLQLARKKLLAELELSGGITIPVNGQELSRQDILGLFDSLADEQVLANHVALFSDKPLLDFLENADISAAAWQEQEAYQSPAFKVFVSPYFAQATSMLLQNILKGTQPLDRFTALFDRPQWLLMQDAEVAFATANKFYFRRKAAVQAFAVRMEESVSGSYDNVFDPVLMAPKLAYIANEQVTQEEIVTWREETNIPLLNLLPDDFFGELRYDIANELNNLCVIADTQQHSTKVGYEALLTAARIDCGTSLQEIIRDNLEIFKAKLNPRVAATKRTASKENTGFSWSGIGVAIFIIVRLVLAASTCNSSHAASSVTIPIYTAPAQSAHPTLIPAANQLKPVPKN